MTTSHDERLTPRSGGRTAAGRYAAGERGHAGERRTPGEGRPGRAPRAGAAGPRTGVAGPRAGAAGRGAEQGRLAYPTAGSAALKPVEPTAATSAPGDEARSQLRVAPPAPVATPRAPFVLLVLTVVISGVLGILVLNTKINENAFQLHDLQEKQTALDVHEQQLADELAQLEDPGNLRAAARRLGLVDAGTPAFIRLPDGRVLGIPQPANGQPSVTSQQASATG